MPARGVLLGPLAAALVVLALLSGVAACGSDASDEPAEEPARTRVAATRAATPTPRAPTSPTPTPPGTDRDAIAGLLARRAAALGRGDAAAYAATAHGRQRRRDARAARRARVLPLRDVELWAEDLTFQGPRRARARLVLSYGIRGVAGTYATRRRLRLVRVGSRWRVRREGSARERPPWEVAPYEDARSRHFVLLSPAGLPARATGLLGALETARARMRPRLPADALPRRTLVLLAAGPAETRRLTRGIRGVDALAAVADADVREAGPARRVQRVLSQRLVLNWPRMAALGAAGRARVLAHELTHVALAGRTSGRTPAWLVEGIALWSSGDDRRAAAGRALAAPRAAGLRSRRERRVLSLGGLAGAGAISRLEGPAQVAAYAYASAAVHHIAARYGRRPLLRLHAAFNDPGLPGAPGRALSAAAVRRTLGDPLAEVERDLRRGALAAAGEAPGPQRSGADRPGR